MLDIEKPLSKLIAIPTSPISQAQRLLSLFMFEYFDVFLCQQSWGTKLLNQGRQLPATAPCPGAPGMVYWLLC